MQVCRICLATNVKLYKIQKTMRNMYELTTGLCMSQEDRLPQKVCWECSARLVSSSRLRDKARRSHELMMRLLHSVTCLSTKSLKTIDREANSLNSTLSRKTYGPNYSDVHLHDTTADTNEVQINEIEKDVQLDLEIKGDIEPNDLDVVDQNGLSSSDEVLAKHKKKGIANKKRCKKKREKQEGRVDGRRRAVSAVIDPGTFTVSALSAEEQARALLRRRDSGSYARAAYKCLHCYKGFLREDAYAHHALRHTDKIGVHACSVCKIHFRTRHALRNHAAAHAHRFSCNKCAYVTTRRHAAKLHEEYHNGTRYRCPHCQDEFLKFSTYMSHVRMKHPSRFVCARCGCSFVSAKGLALHDKLKHRFDERQIPADGPRCDKCDLTFVAQDALERHIKLSASHSEESIEGNKRIRQARDPLKSQDKGQNEDKKNRRATPGKPEGPIPCEQCEMQLPDPLAYYRHFRRAHPDKNRTNYPSMKSRSMCEVCGKMFQSLALLQDHSWTHAEGAQFSCGVCHKRFQRAYRLIAHRRLHAAPAASHACRQCPKRFSTASNLQRHMASHTGLKPFKCEMCGKGFKHASEKRVHITYVHLKKPWPKRSRGKRRSDGRQNQPPQPVPTCESETDIVQPLWPSCSDPKIPDSFVQDRQVYYGGKI